MSLVCVNTRVHECVFLFQSGAFGRVIPVDVVDGDTEGQVRRQGLLGTLLSTVYVTNNKHPTNKYQPLTMLSKPSNDPSVSPDVNSAKSGCKNAARNKH